ncbi:MAG: succinate dehydrogenase, hydrophobic membrane anchor protein [Steroidobacteraceae bacterium]
MSQETGNATRHWRNQRMTSIALLPLASWFLFSLLRQPDLDHATVTAWLAQPLQAALAVLFGGLVLWHSIQGLRVVLEDYVGGRWLAPALWSSRVLHGAAAAAFAWAMWTIAGGGSA